MRLFQKNRTKEQRSFEKIESEKIIIQSVEDCEKNGIEIFDQIEDWHNIRYLPFSDEMFLYLPVFLDDNKIHYFKIPFEAQNRG